MPGNDVLGLAEQSRVAAAGDWHGDAAWAALAIACVGAEGIRVLLHQGDFSIWPGSEGEVFLRTVERACRTHDVTVLLTPGNHEDYDQIGAHPLTDRGDGLGPVAWFSDHVAVLPRGTRFHIGGRSFVSLGGAPSVNYDDYTPGGDWWPGEAITLADVLATTSGGRAEVMLSHDSPDPGTPAAQALLSANPGGYSARGLAYANHGRMLLTGAFSVVCPKVLFHGHLHVSDAATVAVPDPTTGAPTEDACLVVSLAAERSPGNLVWLDLANLHVRQLHVGDAHAGPVMRE